MCNLNYAVKKREREIKTVGCLTWASIALEMRAVLVHVAEILVAEVATYNIWSNIEWLEIISVASNKCTVRDRLDNVTLENIQSFNSAGGKKTFVNCACLNFFSLQRVVRHCETHVRGCQ